MKDNASPEGRPRPSPVLKPVQPGALVYVMGPSGCGKDSLMRYARGKLDEAGDIAFAHRYITRPPEAGGENHVALSEREFAARRRMGLFALHWRAHGRSYGVGIEVDAWLSRGWTVVMNGSRACYPKARQRYPRLFGVLIDVSPEDLKTRLSARARESPQAIHTRLARNEWLSTIGLDGAVRIRNDRSLPESGERFVRCILQSRDAQAP